MSNAVSRFIKENWKNVIRENTSDEDSLLGLPHPYTVSCIEGMFRELYYWGTYFTNVGLILSGEIDLAKNNIDDMTYLISQYGFIPNGNRTFFLDRSQPPFLSQMVVELYEVTKDRDWLMEKYSSLKEEYAFWQKERMTVSGLNRYYGNIRNKDEVIRFGEYLCSRFSIEKPFDLETLYRYGEAMYAFAESGWDCTSRFGMEPHLYNSVEQNCMLYGMEKNLAYIAAEIGSDEISSWEKKAEDRKQKMNTLMWNKTAGFFADYNFVSEQQNDVVATSTFYPLFVKLADEKQAASIRSSLVKIEEEHGLASTEKRGALYGLQWDHPYGWPCQQYAVIKGLLNYGFTEDAFRLAEKYIRTVERNFDTTSQLWEKYNVCTGGITHNKEYKTPAILGWTAGAYLYCLKLLDRA